MPIEFACNECSKTYRVKDELAGKKIKCSQCEAVVEVPTASRKPATKKTESASRPVRKKVVTKKAAKRPTTKKKVQKKRRPAPELYDDDDDAYGDDGLYDDGGYDQPPARAKKKKTKPTSKKSGPKGGAKKKGGGLPPVTFNLNRINIALVIIGGMVGFFGISEWRLAMKSGSTPTRVSLTELTTNGAADNVFVTVTDMMPAGEGEFVYEETRTGRYSKIWYPAVPTTDSPGVPRFIVYSADAKNDNEVGALMMQTEQTGMIVNSIRSLDSETKDLLQQGIPGINVDSALIFESGRKPAGPIKYLGLLLLGLALVGGGMFWIFFVHG